MGEKFDFGIFCVAVLVALVKAQRNIQSIPAPNGLSSNDPSNIPDIETTTWIDQAPYAASGYRPGPKFDPSNKEEKNDIPDTSYGPPTETSITEIPTTTEYIPYPAGGLRPGKAFNYPSEDRKVDEIPTDGTSYPAAGFQPNPSFEIPNEVDQGRKIDEEGSGSESPSEFDLVPAASEFSASIRFPTEQDNDDNPVRIMSGQGVLQTRPSGIYYNQNYPEHRFLRPGPSYPDNRVTKVVMLRPNQNRRPIRPLTRPVTGAQTTLQTRPSFGRNPGFGYEQDPVLITTIRLPDPFAFTRFLDTF